MIRLLAVLLALIIPRPSLAASRPPNSLNGTLEKTFHDLSFLLKNSSSRTTTSLAVRGSPNAKITLLEYGDFDCPYTARMHPTTLQLLRDHPDTVRLVFKMKPLLFHPEALPAALRWAAVVLYAPSKAWPYFDALFEGKLAGRLGAKYYHEIDQKLGIDSVAVESLIASGAPMALVSRDAEEFDSRGLQGTPTFFVNGREIPPAPEFIEYEIRKLEQAEQP